ncbi:hypothetical protein BH09SUM1_BH09SUM1_03940 [soil metagenome]
MNRFLKRGFTLIELLIVVAIIAILAAIAVPNFLEAQVRSKVSRCLADTRTIRLGIEVYYVDNNKYPETDQGIVALAAGKKSYFRLTTPIAYLTSIPGSPFKEQYGSSTAADPKIASKINGYLYVNKKKDANTVDPDYRADRSAYVLQGALASQETQSKGEWNMKSVGPDNIDDRDGMNPKNTGVSPRAYDPTNGTVSRGDIVLFSDLPNTGKY